MQISRKDKERSRLPATIATLLLLAVLAGCAGHGPWTKSSDRPVPVLHHATLDERIQATGHNPDRGFRFVAFGDQRALADGEWQQLMVHIGDLAVRDPELLFMIDSGDIVQSGEHSDQFHTLVNILEPARSLPYWVGIGNHEVSNNKESESRKHIALFLSEMESTLTPDRLYYRKDVGPARFLFLDSNDLVYGESGQGPSPTPPPGSRTETQLQWLMEQLEEDHWGPTIAALHHPFVQSSSKHRQQARALWRFSYLGRTLPQILLEGGVDLVLAGHTHTYERFRLEKEGRALQVLNLSGRPRNAFLWFGAGSRRARNIQGSETEWLKDQGWTGLDGWTITQEAVMDDDEADQFGVITVEDSGNLSLEILYLDGETVRSSGTALLR